MSLEPMAQTPHQSQNDMRAYWLAHSLSSPDHWSCALALTQILESTEVFPYNGPPLKLRSLWIRKSWNKVRKYCFFSGVNSSKVSLDSGQIAQLQGIPSQIRVEVTGMHSSPDWLMPQYI